MSVQKTTLAIAAMTVAFVSCKKDKDPVIVIPPSSGSTIITNGLVGSESGANAGNSVYFDLSTNKQTSLERKSWDLGFYGGNEFRVTLNNTASAGAKVTTKTDLATVSSADTVGLTLAVSQFAPAPAHFAFFDALDGSLTGTVIPEIPANAADSKVIIINRGNGGGITPNPRAWYKIKITRNAAGGYTLQYGELNAATFQTLNITKDASYLFQLVSLENGILANGQPEKSKWDFVWSYSLFQTNFGSMVPYNFSDMIALNNLAGVQAKEKVYADNATAAAAYAAFNRDSVNKSENTVIAGRWTIGSGWRVTSTSAAEPVLGAKLNKFYIVKDAEGHYYKLKCLSMGSGADGGTRGKPVFEYALIP